MAERIVRHFQAQGFAGISEALIVRIGIRKGDRNDIEQVLDGVVHPMTLIAFNKPYGVLSQFTPDGSPHRPLAEFGFPNIITFSGNRKGMSNEEGLENCVKGLKRLVPIAEKYKVTVCMELLNSKRSHKDYMCDHTAWGVEVCKRVGSDRLKLLYDIFHMQIMEGDMVDTIRENHQYIGHYHTGGVPGRNEIDESQEIYYPAVMKAIVATGYKGFVGQEFVPKRPDPLASLRECVLICDV